MRIEKIEISNYHCYKDAVFEFAPQATILIGKNGSGKTSLIKSLKNALSVFFSNNPSWGYPTVVGGVSDLGVSNLDSREIWHDSDMKPADYVDVRIEAVRPNYESGENEQFPSWSFHKSSTANAKLQSSYYKDAYMYFRESYTDNDTWPLFAYYSDRYPHIDAKLSDSIKKMIDNDEKLYRCWGYYHWDNDSSCALIWQKRFMRIYNLYFKRLQTLRMMTDLESEEAQKCRADIDKYAAEIQYVLNYVKRFTSNDDEALSDRSNILTVSDLIVDGIDNQYIVAYFADGSRRRWDELPAGYERLYNIVFDIAYRSYILNGCNYGPRGIIMIDELDLHLHPSMEQDVLHRLITTFPDVQFIVSTHSPLVLSNMSLGNDGAIILLHHSNNGYEHSKITDLYGMEYQFILSSIMKTEPQNVRLQQLKRKYLRLMRRGMVELAQQTLNAIGGLVSPERFIVLTDELNGELKEEAYEVYTEDRNNK